MDALVVKRDELLAALQELRSCAVAFSGGVDSAVVAFAAQLTLGPRSVAVTAVSPSLASGEREQAAELARQIGIRHVELHTQEMADPGYVANQGDRCYFCKSELYGRLQPHLTEWGVEHIVNGTNVDDLGDHRPGLRAAQDFNVVSPLADAGFTKSDVRELAQHWGIAVADKPATPCLSSRIAYGESVTEARLSMIDHAERWLRERGLRDTRVRYHGGDLARLEVHLPDIGKVTVEPLRSELTAEFARLGFKFVTLDLQGRRSGSLNVLVPLEELERQR